MRYKRHTKEDLEPIVLSSKSYAECLRKLDRVPAGGNYNNLIRNIKKFGINTDHMTHQAHNAGVEIKTFDKLTSNTAIKKRLIKESGHKCWKCGLTEWENEKIPLELDHINGDSFDNSRENLRVLCPNCHALTPTWRRRSSKKG